MKNRFMSLIKVIKYELDLTGLCHREYTHRKVHIMLTDEMLFIFGMAFRSKWEKMSLAISTVVQ